MRLVKRPVSDRHQAEVGGDDQDDVLCFIMCHQVGAGVSLHVASSCLLCQMLSEVVSLLPFLSTLSLLSASKQFAGEVLQCHNEYRKKHQAPPLKLSSKLSREAARWVNAHTDRIREPINKGYAYQLLSNCCG